MVDNLSGGPVVMLTPLLLTGHIGQYTPSPRGTCLQG